jgi:hypothetical protein
MNGMVFFEKTRAEFRLSRIDLNCTRINLYCVSRMDRELIQNNDNCSGFLDVRISDDGRIVTASYIADDSHIWSNMILTPEEEYTLTEFICNVQIESVLLGKVKLAYYFN